MTREEAIKILKQIQRLYGGLYATSELKETYNAFDMAIKSLSAENPKADERIIQSGDLISRADVLALAEKGYIISNSNYKKVCDLINELPSADRPSGEWIKHKGEWIDFDFYPTKYECSQCHYYVDEGYDSIYCPNCGAEMKGEK